MSSGELNNFKTSEADKVSINQSWRLESCEGKSSALKSDNEWFTASKDRKGKAAETEEEEKGVSDSVTS